MSERYSRQSFLGEAGQRAIETARVCINGLGGGGSIIAPELAHLGVQNFVLYDPDHGDESNLNRTMTLTDADIAAGTLPVRRVPDAAAHRRLSRPASTARSDAGQPCGGGNLPLVRPMGLEFAIPTAGSGNPAARLRRRDGGHRGRLGLVGKLVSRLTERRVGYG